MKQYEITRSKVEIRISISRIETEYSVEDVLDEYAKCTATDNDLVSSFASLAEAKDEYEILKSRMGDCAAIPSTWGFVIEPEILQLWEVEYDDGEYDQGRIVEEYAERFCGRLS